MYREDQIVHENGAFWILAETDGTFTVLKNESCYAVTDSSYDDLSIAKARCDYLAKRNQK